MKKDLIEVVIYKHSNKTIVKRSNNQLKKFNPRRLKKNKRTTGKLLSSVGTEIMLYNMKIMHAKDMAKGKRNKRGRHLKKVMDSLQPTKQQLLKSVMNLGDFA